MSTVLEKLFRTIFLLSLAVSILLYWHKDELPDAAFYDLSQLHDPLQTATRTGRFSTRAGGRDYLITPRYDYELEGVVVSYHDADDFIDTTHHERWQDFINLRDLCVIWGSNVENGVYQDMEFHNGSWTCWYSWPNSEVRDRFDATRLSNNHLLIDDDAIREKLMSAEPGDHIRLKGMLVAYSNPANGFRRGTSTVRTDTGDGACETIYVSDFEIVNKANRGLRGYYAVSSWVTLLSLAGVVVMFVVTPYRGRYR
jgi:hypothetical protein